MIFLTATLALATPNLVIAQDEPVQPAEALLGRARTLLEETEFEEAGALLDHVSDDIGFTRADVVEWLVLRLRVASALRDPAGIERELSRLAALTDDPTLPPVLLARFEALRASVQPIRTSLERDGSYLVARVSVEDPTLIRARRIHIEDAAGRRSATDRIRADRADRCRVEVIGPGGAVLASESACPAMPVIDVSVDPEPPQSGGIDDGWLAVGISVALALVGGGVVLGVVLSQDGSASVPVQSIVVSW